MDGFSDVVNGPVRFMLVGFRWTISLIQEDWGKSRQIESAKGVVFGHVN